MAKIKKVESAKVKAERVKNEKILSSYREMFRSDERSIKSMSYELLNFSKDTRRITMFDLSTQLIETLRIMDGKNLDQLRTNTPQASKDLTEIIKLRNEANKYKDNKHQIEKYKSIWTKVKEHNNKFEISLRELFDSVEALLNALLLSTDIVYNFSKALDLCLEYNMVKSNEATAIKVLGHIRNLFTHNSSSYFLIRNIDEEKLLFFKACVLEVKDIMFNLLLKHRTKMATFGGYIKLKTLEKEGKDVPNELVLAIHEMYELMLVDDTCNNVTLVKEIFKQDEVKFKYITKIHKDKVEWSGLEGY